jgi:hypothetical protein
MPNAIRQRQNLAPIGPLLLFPLPPPSHLSYYQFHDPEGNRGDDVKPAQTQGKTMICMLFHVCTHNTAKDRKFGFEQLRNCENSACFMILIEQLERLLILVEVWREELREKTR